MGAGMEPINNKRSYLKSFFQFWMEWHEWVLAVLCGILLVTGYLISQNNETVGVIAFLFAFVLGGFAKAKEGITETIKDRSLNVELLMFLAAIGSAVIGYWWEGGVLIFIFALSGALESYTDEKSRKELSALMELQPETALKLTDEGEMLIPAAELVRGDRILVKPGERVPVDCTILEGRSSLNEAAITGESVPVFKSEGDDVFGGAMNTKGSLMLEVKNISEDSLVQKIIRMVQSAEEAKSPSQLFIERFEDLYVRIVLGIVVLMLFLPHYLIGWSWTDTFYRAMILLVVASPCALVASIMPATLSAVSNGARRGILFKGGGYIETLSIIKVIGLDKTGTLTMGSPDVTDVAVIDGEDEKSVLSTVAALEKMSLHPLGEAIADYYCEKFGPIPAITVRNLEETGGRGLTAEAGGANWLIGSANFLSVQHGSHEFSRLESEWSQEGKTLVYIKRGETLIGILALKDTVRQEAVAAIRHLKLIGIKPVLITGDKKETAESIAKETGIEETYAECLPETKLETIHHLRKKYGPLAMVGDGINDAPALAAADTGIAMGAGSDAAMETADIVLVKNKLDEIPYAIEISKKMNRIIKQNIIFAVSVIVLLILSNFVQIINLPFGVVGHEGSTILVILNSLRLLKPMTEKRQEPHLQRSAVTQQQ